MSGTFTSLHYHLIFSTKNRGRFISVAWMARLHDYLGGTVQGLGGYAQGIGGVEDHVHLLVGLKPTHCLSDFMRELKKGTSIWVHEEIGLRDFAWQEGYAAFTASATSREQIREYIANQAEHHHVRSFQDELKQMLTRAGVAFKAEHLV